MSDFSIQWSFENYLSSISGHATHIDHIANWLVDTSLFEQAWATVCSGPLNWWWSEQLCLFTAGAWTVFLAIEGAIQIHFVPHQWLIAFRAQT